VRAGVGIEVCELVRDFGDRRVLHEVSFPVRPGRVTGFVGANGAGKTTTMRIVMGVLSATSGAVREDGQPVTVEQRRAFGYLPEERGLYPKMRVGEQLRYFARLHGVDRSAAATRTSALLERLELASRADDVLETLSLGNQQRAQIAAALVHDPTALILDEPFSGLDPLAVDVLAELLRERVEDGVPLLFSSHQLELVERLCDDLVILNHGRVVAAGSVDELRRSGGKAYELHVQAGSDLDWVGAMPSVRMVALRRGTDGDQVAASELGRADAEQEVLREAMRRGPVRELRRHTATVAEIFRESVQ